MITRKSIKGILQKEGRPVPDAAVMVKEGDYEFNDIASISNEQGEFFVAGVGIPGRYVLQIEHGTASTIKEVDIHSAETVIYINL